jgi:hypothetical protein
MPSGLQTELAGGYCKLCVCVAQFLRSMQFSRQLLKKCVRFRSKCIRILQFLQRWLRDRLKRPDSNRFEFMNLKSSSTRRGQTIMLA